MKEQMRASTAFGLLAISAAASAVHGATITPVVKLNFTNPAIGAYGADPGGTSLPAGTSAATYSESGAVYGSSNYVYTDTSGNGPTFANGMVTTSPTSFTNTHDPGLSISPATGTYNLTQNIVMEAEVTSAGQQQSGTTAIIQWELDTADFPRIDLDMSNGELNANAYDNANPNNPTIQSTTTLVTGVETHVAVVYTYGGTGSPSTLTLYTINDQTGLATVLGTTSTTESYASLGSDSLNGQIGILNTPESGAGAGQPPGGRGFNGSADSIFVGTWTGTFNPADATIGGDFQLVPEPASMGLLSIGATLSLLRRRNRRLE